jgi:hypothetical protein
MTVVNTRLLDFWVALLRGKGVNVRTLWIAVLSFLPAVAGAQMLGASLISTSADGLIYTSGISVTTNQASVTSLYASGKVGIGTATTTNGKLEVQTTSGKAIYAASTANSYTIWGTNSNSGGVGVYGINTNTGSVGAIGYANYGVYCPTGSCGGGAAWNASSDARLKERIQPLSDNQGLAAIEKLRPVTYHWRDARRDRKEGEQIGFIAQDVKAVFPNLVLADKGTSATITLVDGKTENVQNPMSLKYELLVAPLVKAVQELKADNDDLRARLEKLEGCRH